MKTNNRWKQFKAETSTNTFKKPKENSRWKKDDEKQNESNFKKPQINSRFSSLISNDDDELPALGAFGTMAAIVAGIFASGRKDE